MNCESQIVIRDHCFAAILTNSWKLPLLYDSTKGRTRICDDDFSYVARSHYQLSLKRKPETKHLTKTFFLLNFDLKNSNGTQISSHKNLLAVNHRHQMFNFPKLRSAHYTPKNSKTTAAKKFLQLENLSTWKSLNILKKQEEKRRKVPRLIVQYQGNSFDLCWLEQFFMYFN